MAFCPTCRGLMRPERGVLVCLRCRGAGRATTVMAGGRRIQLGSGQQGLTAAPPPPPIAGLDPPLAPKDPSWRPPEAAASPHPQWGLFPYDGMRDGQRRMARDVAMAVQGGRHLVAQAPTGIGKTAASLAPALEAARAQDRTVLFLTSRQSQHRIAVETVRLMRERRGVPVTLVDLVAKRDMCLRPEAREMHPGRFADFCGQETRRKSCQYLGEVGAETLREVRRGVLHVEELMGVSKRHGLCPHLVAMAAAPEADVVVADYNHVFSDIRERSLQRLGLSLGDLILIVDEAHNLPERIRQSHSHRVTPYLLDQVEAEARGHRASVLLADLVALRAAFASAWTAAERAGTAQDGRLDGADGRVARLQPRDLHEAFESQRNRTLLGTHRTLADLVKDLVTLAGTVRKGTDAVVHAEQLAEAIEDWDRFGDAALRYLRATPGFEDQGIELHLRLLDPAAPAGAVFKAVHSAILMSGTLRPPEMVRDLLGLEPGRTAVRQYPDPFPPEHRLVCVDQGVSTRYSRRGEEEWDRIAAHLAGCLRDLRGNAAVFCPSYSIVREVAARLGGAGKEPIVEDPAWGKAERAQVLDQLAGARDRGGAVLVGVLGGSFAEGIDFRDNLLSLVAVVGLPLAPPDLEVEAGIEHLERRHPGKGRAYGYVMPAMNRVLQAMGRGVRGPDDRCAILLLDERYLGPPYRQLLPPELPLVASNEPAEALRGFVQANGL